MLNYASTLILSW